MVVGPTENELRRWREYYGLDPSDRAIERAVKHPDVVWVDQGSVPLTPDEHTLLQQRGYAAVPPDIDSWLSAEARAHFAGMYFDRTVGFGQWMIGFTLGRDENLLALREHYANPDRLVAFGADFTLAELEAVQEEVYALWPEIRKRGIEINAAEVEVERNRVVVSLERMDDHAVEVLRSLSDRIEVKRGPRIGEVGWD